MRVQFGARAALDRFVGLVLAVGLGLALWNAPALAETRVRGQLITSWALQLQNPDPATIAKTPYDLIVIDYSRDASDALRFTREEVEMMKKKPDGSRRIVIAYMSIGEIEDYRYYWAENGWSKKKKRPSWIKDENPEWKSNYTVKFWYKGWQDIIYGKKDSYLNRLIDAGFDGAYLDKIDITDVLEDDAPAGISARDLMVQFVRKIWRAAMKRDKDFALVASNAEPLLDDDDYLEAMSAIGKEDLFYGSRFIDGQLVDGFEADPDVQKEMIRLMTRLKDAGKAVLAVEYLDSKPELIQPTANKLLALDYVPYFGPRDLARISDQTFARVASSGGATSLGTARRIASTCSGLVDEAACTTTKDCTWIRGFRTGPDKEVPGYCRSAPRSTVQRLGLEPRAKE